MTKKSRRYISVFLAAAMITTFTPAEMFSVTAEDISYPAAQADSVSSAAAYMEGAWSGSEVTYTAKTADNCTAVDSTATAWTAGWYVVSSSVTVAEPITVSGDVNLILADGCTLNANSGIVVPTGSSLTVYAQSGGSGTLNAVGTSDGGYNVSAGIGGSAASPDSGSITIHGGIINAAGGGKSGYIGAAGIGGGTKNGADGGSSGPITVYGGTVTAVSGEGNSTGAGIGGSAYGNSDNGGSGSNITIYGGNVTARSQDGGAGIGGGAGGFGKGGAGDNISIYGGTVTATGGNMGAGIGGGGVGGSGTSGSGNNITVSGGNVTAIGGKYAAGIGGGGGYKFEYGGTVVSNVTGCTGSVTVTGGIVDAKGGAGNSGGNYAGSPLGSGGNLSGGSTSTVTKTTGIVFENGVGKVYGNVTLTEPLTLPDGYSLTFDTGAAVNGEINAPNAAAKAEKDGNIIGYLDTASFEGTNSVFMQNAYEGSTITLLSDVQPDTSSESGKTCSTMVNISCTLDLNGYDLSSSGIAVYVLPNGVLTVQDSSVSKTGRVISTADAAVENNGRLTLKDGTYSGDPAIKTAEGLSGVLPSETGSYYAFYRDGKPVNITEQENQKELAGTVTVKLCAHDGVTPASNNDGTHTLNCPCCGSSGTAENCTYSDEYTTDETNHTKTCTKCGYEKTEAHTFTLTATANSNNNITLSEACDICGYKKELGTVAVDIPELIYGETDKSVTLTGIPVDCLVMFKADDGSEFQNGDGDTEVSRTLGELFGDSEMTAGEHKLKLTFINADNKYSNECELTFTVKECPHESDVIEAVSNNNGTHTATCTRCGHTETVNCTYGDEYITDETNHTKTCTVCGYSVTEAHTSTGSNAATCAKKAVCDACGLEYGDLAEHNYSTEWQSDENDHWHECTVCHNDKKDITPHSWNSGVVTTEATEETEGVKLFTCTVCGKTKTEKIDVLPHTHILTKTDAKAPTCVTAGNTEYWTCSRCHKHFSDENGTNEIALNDTVQAATGVHNYVDGVCTVCGGSDPNYSESTETSPSETEPPVTDPTDTDSSVTEPPVTDPTSTDPSVTEPPVTDPGGTEPTATVPSVTNPTGTEPTVTEPTGTRPTFTEPPVIYPPYTPSTPVPAVTETAVQSDREQPFIQGDSGKSGWDAISDIISSTPDGGTVTVDMNNSTTLPKDIVSKIKGRDIDLVLVMKNKFVWTVNGTSVRSAKTVNMKVQRSVNISASTVEEYFGDIETVQIQLAHNGDFGFTAELSVSLGSRYNGMTAGSYCYKAGKFSFGDSAEIADGSAKLKFDHASNWLIVITDTAAEDVSADAGISAKGDPVGSEGSVPLLFLTVIPILGTAFVLFKKSKQK